MERITGSTLRSNLARMAPIIGQLKYLLDIENGGRRHLSFCLHVTFVIII